MESESESNIQGSGNARIENYTEVFWAEMADALVVAGFII